MIDNLRCMLSIVVVTAAFGCGNPAVQNQSKAPGMPGTPTPVPSASGISITSVSPSSAAVGAEDFSITLVGTKFQTFQPQQGFTGTLVGWTRNAKDLHRSTTWLQTNVVDSTQLTAVIPAALLQNDGKGYVYVEVGDIMGISDGVNYPKSNVVEFDVLP